MRRNIVLDTDAYKLTHWKQYPKGLTKLYSYAEARKGGKSDKVLFFGLQAIIKQNLMITVTDEMIKEAQQESIETFGYDIINVKCWEKVRDLGYLPIRIKAVKEGTVLPESNILFTLESTEPWFATAMNSLETVLMHMWWKRPSYR